jgi:hypothetical protein
MKCCIFSNYKAASLPPVTKPLQERKPCTLINLEGQTLDHLLADVCVGASLSPSIDLDRGKKNPAQILCQYM